MFDAEKIVLIKYGGHAMEIANLREAFGRDLYKLRQDGWCFVIVHGGGPHIARLLDSLGIESKFVDGLRVTDKATLEVVEMILCGQVNKEVTRLLEKAGIPAVGISGQDGPTLFAREKNEELGRVGEITAVNPALLLNLLNDEYLPVIAPLALDKNYEPLNINADTAAGAIAGTLKAAFFIFLSDVPGVLNEQSKLLRELDSSAIEKMRKTGIISGGMIPKLQACLQAIELGCKEAIILDGRQENCISRFIYGKEAIGSVIRK